MIALANRPGFPFLGNDFFSEMGKQRRELGYGRRRTSTLMKRK
jgi:hypothetical protein